jgi:acyl-CoA synthetase (AMP-forming)/AMP-acid ligase II
MRDELQPPPSDLISLVHGLPLAEEPGMGALTIPGYAREVTRRFAEREALVLHGPDGVERWSYAELWARSVAVAKALVAAGVGKGGRVGILMTNRPEYLALVFGAALAGGVSVPLSTFSTAPELEHLVAASCVSTLIFERRVLKKDFAAMLGELEPQIVTAENGELASAKFPFLRRLVMLEGVTEGARIAGEGAQGGAVEAWDSFLGAGRAIPDAVIEARAEAVTAADPAVLFFSSGTTSLPKGILHAQRALAIQWWRWARVMGAEEPVRSWTGNGFFWSGNLSMVVGMALTTGGAVVLQPTFQPQAALELMEKERVTFPNGRPHQWARLQEAPNWATADLGSAKYIDPGSLLAQHPTIRTEWRLPLAFGTTETLTVMTHLTAAVPWSERKPGDFGPPLPGNTLKIVDPMTGEIVPQGQRGEVAIKGPTLMMGYIGKPLDETLDDQGFFRTGDGGYVDAEGHLFWEGRLNDLIKTGGANVSPLEIDDLLAKYPGVKQSQTVGVPHDTLSEMVVACILPKEEAALDESAIVAFLKERLASFKVPRRIVVFREDEWPVTGSGKPKAAALRDLAYERLDPAGAAAKRQSAAAEA